MKVVPVSNDIYVKHENEWEALRAAHDSHADRDRIAIGRSIRSPRDVPINSRPDDACSLTGI
ncbi:hypothetical protein ASE04_09835 [Rhizobium sp. Root708]|uniref:hypothetical protein n=1 Tax=Rhizobium sp. Root708 TaxID=1736592 RepID=UPI0006FFA303|nr:hypothetical protein [Rhizobium sp. Root708]KRB51820.1 hypothetical protein ASE04_09835 [Rhizobium sp. Root708]